MYLEFFQLKEPPFRQEPDPEIFFPGAGRRALLEHLVEDLDAGKPLIKLTGSEGVGKTLIYLLLTRKLPPEKYDLVCLDHPVGSFEDLLRIICIAQGLEADDDPEKRDYVAEFHQHLQAQKEAHRKVLLIIDEAEKLFLATLERLVRMICDTEESGTLQILLVGRLDLDPNLDQLAIYCSSIDVNAGYAVEPLTYEETQKYLQFRLHTAGIPGDKHLMVFTDDAVSAIYQAAMGNVSLTNMLAEKGLVDAYSQGLVQVEPELINPQNGEDNDTYRLLIRYGDWLKQHKRWVISGVAVLLVLLIASIWSDKGEKQPDTTYEEPIEAVDVTSADDLEVVSVPAEEEALIYDEEKEPEEVTDLDVTEETDDYLPDGSIEQEADVPVPAVEEEQIVSEEIKEPVEIVVQAESRKKKSPVVQTGPEEEFLPSDQDQTAGGRDGEILFKNRLKASSNWLAWAYRGGFTIQLMVLASENAEENLKRMLVEDEYFSEIENLYILRKTAPKTIFVFYGKYDSISAARQVRNSMPVFLRKHHPYALSIDAALKKTEDQ